MEDFSLMAMRTCGEWNPLNVQIHHKVNVNWNKDANGSDLRFNDGGFPFGSNFSGWIWI